MKEDREEELIKYEDSLLKRESSLRRSVYLAIALIVLIFYFLFTQSYLTTGIYNIAFCLIIICILLAYQYNLKVKHIESIKFYRKKGNDIS